MPQGYATFTNDLSVGEYFTLSGRIGVDVPLSQGFVAKLNFSLNVTNITDKKAASARRRAPTTSSPSRRDKVFGTIGIGF